jgi:hypothetical protein
MSAINIIKAYAKKSLTKNRGSGIMELPSDMVAESRAGEIAAILQKAGLPINQLDDYIRSEADLLKFLNIIEASSKPRVIPATSAEGKAITEKLFGKKGEVVDMTGKKIDTSQGIMGGKSVKEIMESGQVQKGTQGLKKSDKVVKREMFEEANERFNKTDVVADTVTKMISMEPVAAMKEANKVIGRKGIYKNLTEEQSQKILKDTDDWIFQRDPGDLYDYKNKRPFRDDPNFDPDDPDFDPDQGYYTGGMVDVEPNLSDIGHGSDALMARTRLVSPNSQATTSTGLNYLLAEDNDNIRVPFAAGGGGRRAFLKLMATLGGGVAAAKTGILGLGEGAGKQAAKEIVKSAGSGTTPPPYFFDLVTKIKMFGKKSKVGPQERVNEFSYTGKNGDEYLLTEDIVTGDARIVKDKLGGVRVSDDEVVDGIADRSVMEYRSGKGMADETTGKKTPADEYDEYTVEFDQDGTEAGADILKKSVQKEIIEEATEAVTKKADGGRIGFSGGNLAKFLADRTITGSSRKFLEKVFGKETFENMIRNDPELHRGMLEVVEMFRNRDKEGLKMYLQKFLPHMDDATVEDFIIGSGDTAGIEGQLIRLGSGRDYKGKIEMIKEADNRRKLNALDVSKMKPNAEGGRIGKWMGGPLTIGKGQLRELLKYMAKGASHGKTPSEMLQLVNPKQFNKMLNDPATMGKVTADAPEGMPGLIKNYTKKLDSERADMLGELIGTGRKIKKADDDIIKYKMTIIEDMVSKGMDRKTAENMAETLATMVEQQAGKKATPKITEQGLLEMENIQKNLLTKDRKLQATGGLTTMLGE